MNNCIIDPDKLYREIDNIIQEITEIRHTLHKIPELMFKEYKTSAFIREYLGKLDIEIQKPYMETDTVAVIRGGRPGRTLLLRADIDALPVNEETGVLYRSEHSGFSHSCGHDGHTAILLGAARILSGMKEYIAGNVKLVFQPAEEEGGGGKILVAEGVLRDEPPVDEVYALHGWHDIPVGHIETCSGPLMAAVDNYEIDIIGKGGHAAMPHLSVDPVVIASQVIIAFQNIASRYIDPVDRIVLSVCSVKGGELYNVIPDTVKLRGTVRYFKKELKDEIKGRMESILAGLTSAAGGDYEMRYFPGYIPLVNDSKAVDSVHRAAVKYLGEDKWRGNAEITFGAEDFSFYTDKKPGAFFRLGLGGGSPSLHNSSFDFNDNAITAGIIMMCGIALEP